MHRLITSTCTELLTSEKQQFWERIKNRKAFFTGMKMSLKTSKQDLKSKGLLEDIFNSWEPFGSSGFGSAIVTEVSCCDGP